MIDNVFVVTVDRGDERYGIYVDSVHKTAASAKKRIQKLIENTDYIDAYRWVQWPTDPDIPEAAVWEGHFIGDKMARIDLLVCGVHDLGKKND